MQSMVAIALYLTFYLLLSLLFLLWVGTIFCQCLRIYPFSNRSSGSVGPMFVVFTSNQEAPRRGLEPSVIESFPKFPYVGPDTKVDVDTGVVVKMAGECVVCLGAFEENETLRLLPKCGHVFHAECVDTWLGSHTTCPFCRANLKPEEAPGGPAQPPDTVEVVVDPSRSGG